MSAKFIYLVIKYTRICIPEAVHIKGTVTRVYCMYTHFREFPCMYPGIHAGESPVCTRGGVHRSHIYNIIMLT